MDYGQTFYSRPTWIEINKNSLIYNINNISNHISSKVKICTIIKSNAYGHGLVDIGKILYKLPKVKFLGVTAIEEAIVLRERKINSPILLLGSIFPYKNIKEILHYNIVPTISSVTMLKEVEKYCRKNYKKLKVNLKIDTGMGRIGILPQGIKNFLNEISSSKNVILDGVYTHFSCAGEDKNYTLGQFNLFQNSIAELKSGGFKIENFHCANSAATLLYRETHLDMIRPGLILYGLKPVFNSEKYVDTKPVLSLKSRIVFLKTLPKGKGISYGKTFITKTKTKVATIPVGYADGLMRKLSNIGQVLVKGEFCNILGRVTMDMIMVDVTKIKDVCIGEEVVIIGKQGKNIISAEQVADWCETINYEITTGLSYRIPRKVV
ncbi:MAG: alanine racemase [Endomicrobiia bacterium]